MLMDQLSESERAVRNAFGLSEAVDLIARRIGWCRLWRVRFLLLCGGPAPAPGERPTLRLIGARVTGQLELAYAEVSAKLRPRSS
ncbi:hypothetical protein BJ973_002770 [Actinoplanes tereljensis]|uniref:Uncharacterized protein n=1 Tax=Paractinoplanes tereljensis TaxID=571912 RepID=A0A919NP27_9ACTN|nr:hypothetical protein Ate02nite_51790 [Actinoplanes tereljensis]